MTRSLAYALITPSFRLDFERCAMLVESVERWVSPSIRHYLVIDRRDVPLFKPLLNGRTELLVVEDIVPYWMIRVPGIRRFWLSLRTRPLKNWILQQIVKLSIPSAVSEDVLLNTDSDVFFVAPFEPSRYEKDGLVPLFVETGQRGLIPSNDRWHNVAARLIGLGEQPSYDTNYIDNVIPWRRENVLSMQQRVLEVTGKPWQLALAPQSAFSEYILYGLYNQKTLGPRSGHWECGTKRTVNYWNTTPMTVPQLQELKASCGEPHHSVMISAKSRTDVGDIRRVFFT
jgi:hypothetical protein